MSVCIVACQTLRDELEAAIKTTDLELPVVWIESGLHNLPKKLHTRLQEALDGISDCERVFLLFGTCGNAVLGLKTGAFELVMPRVDDCISLLCGSQNAREEVGREYAAYFLTEGWMRGERNLWVEYQYCVNKYGEEQAKEIAETMYGHYRTLGLLDTGVNPIGPLMDSTKVIADTLGLKQKVIPATTLYINELLLGPWSTERFILIMPHSEITADDLLFQLHV